MPTPRERTEEIERQTLAPAARLAEASKGRERDEPQDAVRTVYQRDRDRISHSKAFRRLKHKTQVFLAPEGDHYRVRLTHTLDVSPHRADRRARAPPERGPDRGDRARPRPGAHAVRPPGRAGAHAVPRSSVPAQRAEPAGGRLPGGRRERPEPHVGGPRRHREPPVVDAAARHARGAGRAVRRPHRLHQPRPGRRGPRRRAGSERAAAADRSTSWVTRTARGSTPWSST